MKKEEEIHENNDEIFSCLRTKLGSTKEAEAFMSSTKEPGCLKKAKFMFDSALYWIMSSTSPDGCWYKTKTAISNGFFPVLKVSFFLYDHIKVSYKYNKNKYNKYNKYNSLNK